jgi:RNA polymerase sigma factor (TIGR02999 family)
MPETRELKSVAAQPMATGARGRATVDQLVPILYDELRRIAHHRLRAEQTGHTLETTGLVHEAYLRLVGTEHLHIADRAHVLAVAAQAMRHVLIDSAVRRKAIKRGGGKAAVPIDQVPVVDDARSDELLALDEALTRLGEIDARQARVVECRFFGGMSIENTALALDLSPATVKRDWALARAWLNRELRA